MAMTFGTWWLDRPTDARLLHRDLPDYARLPLIVETKDMYMDLFGLYDLRDGVLLGIEADGAVLSPANLREALRLLGADAGTALDDLTEEALAREQASYAEGERARAFA